MFTKVLFSVSVIMQDILASIFLHFSCQFTCIGNQSFVFGITVMQGWMIGLKFFIILRVHFSDNFQV